MIRTLMNKLSYWVLPCVALVFSEVQAQPMTLMELKQQVAQILNETGAPAIGIALVEQGEPVWVDALGYADREARAIATKESVFRMGSVSKMTAGVAVMQLVDRGLVSLNDRLAEVLPEFTFENPWEATHPLTIAHLLEHTTGWDVHLAEYIGDAPDSLSLAEGLKRHTASRVSRWAPGTRQAYSNTGPVVAALVVEALTGMRFEDYTKRFIFEPLDMNSTSFFKDANYDRLGVTNYRNGQAVEYLHLYSRPSSSLNTSPQDMVNFLRMFIARGNSEAGRILSAAAVKRMERSETTLGAAAGIDAGYGLTVDNFGFEDWQTTFYGHTGGLPGAITEFIYQPELDAGYVFMINQENPQAFHRLSQLFRQYLLRGKSKPEQSRQPLPEKFQQLDGYYAPINPLFDLGRIQFDLTHIMRFSTTENALHRSPFFGGWTSTDYAPAGSSGDYLVSSWSGQPAVAWVADPVAGDALQVEGVLYQKVSTVVVFARLVGLLLSLSLILIGFVLGLVWLVLAMIRNRSSNPLVRPLGVSIVSTISLLLIPTVIVFGGLDPNLLMQSEFYMWSIFVISLLYPLSVLCGLLLLIKIDKVGLVKTQFGFIGSVFVAHSFLVAYLAAYGLIGFRMWA